MWYQVQNAYDYFGVIQSDDHDPYDSSIEFGSFQQVLNSAKSVMQFTELYDKNKKKIWEGDILVGGMIVEYAAPEFRVTTSNGGTGSGDKQGFWNHVEVIGNIYENPEFIQSLKK